MLQLRPSVVVALAGLAWSVPLLAQEGVEVAPVEVAHEEPPKIQLAILLDTSGSMDGLIEQAKAQIWTIVNTFAMAEHSGKRPQLEVALYQYGNDGFSGSEGHIQKISDLSTDLDLISEELFNLSTNGGEEWCGWAIQSATTGLAWSDSPDDLRVIIIAGNEPFSQGSVAYQKACEGAVRNDIIINTIFCGNDAEGRSTGWYGGAQLGEGQYSFIDQNQAVAEIPAPQDTPLRDLNVQLNATYVYYGVDGEESQTRQEEADNKAGEMAPGVLAQRVQAKATAAYSNTHWDLVDALAAGKVDLAKLEKEELPENMQKMSEAERVAFVEAKRVERVEIQAKIQTLSDERAKFIAQERAKQATQGPDSLGSALAAMIRKQAVEKGYTFKK